MPEDPVKAKLSVGIIGAGPGGIALGILRARAGFRDFTFEPVSVDQTAAHLSGLG
jgi:cation diffusion facilitator CzcD-associated flavoprotein CzcO